ncbi:MAG: BMP family ABC transporter substrate-binding protein [Microbacteriaceae bacterium]|nr:MAG: BMP family ABC transporter substrate-binding protein [Microbacteriaceae bacterium]
MNHTPLRRRMIIALAALATAFVLTACSSQATGAPSGSTKSKITVAFVSPQKAGDNGPIDDMIAAQSRLKAKYGVTTKYIELSDPSTYESTLQNLGQAGTTYVVTAFPGMQQPVQDVAPKFPNTHFVLIFGDKFSPALKNARSISYNIYEAMYVSGVAAANLTKNGSVGYIGGAPQPPLNADYHAFTAGAKSVNPSIKVTGAFVGSFDDAAKGQSIAAAMIAGGVDVVQTDAAAASMGVIKAAALGDTLVLADSSGAVAAQYPKTVVGTTFLKFGNSFYTQISDAIEHGFKGGYATSGLSDGIVGLNISPAFLSGGSPMAAKVKELEATLTKTKEEVSSGAVKVTFDPSNI